MVISQTGWQVEVFAVVFACPSQLQLVGRNCPEYFTLRNDTELERFRYIVDAPTSWPHVGLLQNLE
jgi:hypothetical protein